jgi:hypothetical protein
MANRVRLAITIMTLGNLVLEYVYALYHVPTKSYVLESGYYGNGVSIACFATKKRCEDEITTYYRGKGYRPKRFKLKQSGLK